MENKELDIIYKDDFFVVINKPHGLLVHKSPIAADAQEFALQLVRDQIQQKVFPVHRLDRKTSGVLVFALSSEMASALQKTMENEATQKRYLAIVRGFFPDEIDLDYPLTNDKGKVQEARTSFKTLLRSEIDLPFGQHATSRYSLIEAFPKTGRMHQIRKHLNHLRHPIIGDRPHGCSKQNRLFLEKWNMNTMLLHANDLTMVHPVSQQDLHLEASTHDVFNRMRTVLHL